jgi:hypothetical protein
MKGEMTFFIGVYFEGMFAFAVLFGSGVVF